MGTNFLRNFLFLSICLPDPSILIRCWWNWHTSMTLPVRSNCLGVGQFGFGPTLGHLLVAGLGSWYVHSISLGATCGGVLTPLLVGLGTPAMLCVGGIFQAGCICGDEVLYWSSKQTHGWGNLCGRIWGVPVLEDCCLEFINVNGTISPNIARDQLLDSFDPHLSSAVAVWKCHRAQTMVYYPIGEEIPWLCGIQSRSPHLMSSHLSLPLFPLWASWSNG